MATIAAMSVKLLKMRLSNQLYLPWCKVAKEKNQGKYPAKERTNKKKQREGKNLFSTSKLKGKKKINLISECLFGHSMDPSQGQNLNQPIELSQSAIVPLLDKV